MFDIGQVLYAAERERIGVDPARVAALKEREDAAFAAHARAAWRCGTRARR